jgi:hypothetical protein
MFGQILDREAGAGDLAVEQPLIDLTPQFDISLAQPDK